ncbi:MAG: aminotransferase class V-fold PLP-dependent enzyme [Rubricoccaceae bacterium]|nr:aminotransferase class V-fold PLP-dependent enzyme [Rubricoccaceae bacterium]
MVYLDHASTGPLSSRVREAIAAHLEQRHRTNPNNFEKLIQIIERGRRRVAELLGCSVGRVEYAPNTSSGLNVLALGYPWKKGDRIAVPSCEFPANVQPWLGLRERHGVIVDFIPAQDGTFSLEDVAQTLLPDTRLVSISWVQFLSGFRCDLHALAELVHGNNVLLAVDAIQGLGALRLNVEDVGIDFLACGGQKWLLATQGSAFVYVSDSLQDRLLPVRGWQNGPVDWDDFGAFTDTLHPDATRFRTGTLNSIGCVALDAALSLYLETGPAEIEQQVLRNADKLAEGMTELGFQRFGSQRPEHSSGIVTFDVPSPKAFLRFLWARNIRASVRNQKLRFAPHAYNTDREIDTVLEACSEFIHAVSV